MVVVQDDGTMPLTDPDSTSNGEPHDQADADALVEPAIALVADWLRRASEVETRVDRLTMQRLGELVGDPDGVRFVMRFIDRVARPDDRRVAAGQLRSLVSGEPLPDFLSRLDALLLRVGARVAPLLPAVVMPLAARRMRSIVGHLVGPAEPDALRAHLRSQRSGGFGVNVNLLGEAVLGEREADRRLDELIELVAVPDIDYVSVKITAIASQINHWDHAGSLDRLTGRLARLVDAAASAPTPTFVNLDMEEFHDLHLSLETFTAVLSAPERVGLDAGIVVQAYLPESLDVLQRLVAWANERHQRGGGTIKIRLVKGANLAMERVEAAMHGWPQAPFGTKLESDAGFRGCVDWVFRADRLRGVRIGVASHNLFDVAWAKLLADARGVAERIQFEMLQGMAPAQARVVNQRAVGAGLRPTLLYAPVAAADDFDAAIAYLFRRLEENAAPDNYLRALFDLEPSSPTFAVEAERFRAGTARRARLDRRPRRRQDRRRVGEAPSLDEPFTNAADTDPSIPTNRDWIDELAGRTPIGLRSPVVTDPTDVDAEVCVARASTWPTVDVAGRRRVLHAVADEIEARRGDLIVAMMHEASKTIAEADVEVSEAVDFARWYGDRCIELDHVHGAVFSPFGVIGVIPPWNFPVAIPAGGVLAALAAGNTVLFKPAPQTRRCAELVAEACWAAGVPADALRFVPAEDGPSGRRLVEAVDAVILTGSSETADLFRRWRPDLRLFAETSGKNALIITPGADIDQAVHDLVRSAFGHAGQKCSAASLAILVGGVGRTERFQRQLVDAVESLTVGPATDPGTDIAPLVDGGNERLDRALGRLDAGETWLVEPVIESDGAVRPGIRDGVVRGSWFHRTECFGPVLGLMHVDTLEDAIEIANDSDFGLTGGVHSLDPAEIATWIDSVEIGNGYVNRPITGAIVQRQPFGGWKRSSVGPGAKAGGPNYLVQLGTWASDDDVDHDYADSWREHFAIAHDPTGLDCEANLFRYRPLAAIGVVGVVADEGGVGWSRVSAAAGIAGVELVVGPAGDRSAWYGDLAAAGVERVRFVDCEPSADDRRAAAGHGIHLVSGPVTPAGRLEFLHLVREQALSITLHRFGNLVSRDELVPSGSSVRPAARRSSRG